MKKKVRLYAQQIEVGTQDRRHVLKDFSRMLDNQVRYVHAFLHGNICICVFPISMSFTIWLLNHTGIVSNRVYIEVLTCHIY
jgi:hypothetical protein